MAKKNLKVTLVKSDGSSLYILRDFAAAVHRVLDYKFDSLVYIVDKSQSNHFLALFDILRQVGFNKSKDSDQKTFRHISFGRVSGQSTRSGTFSLLSDVIRDGTDLMDIARASSPNTRFVDDVNISKNLAISSLIINCFKVRRNRDLNFDWGEALKSSGDTGVSLQYGHARLVSLLGKLQEEFLDSEGKYKHPIDYEYILQDPIALDLALQILNFEDALWSSFNDLEPCTLVYYMFRLRDKTYKALKELPVKNEEDLSIASTRYFLFQLAKNLLGYTMSIVGITPLDQM